MLAYSLMAGLLFGLYFSLIGIGLNLVFGVMRIVNLAHGDFVMLGGFLAFWLFTLYALNPVASVFIAFAVFLLVGLPLYYLLVPRLLRAKDPEMLSFILFFGLSQVIEAVTTIAFGTSERSIPGDQPGAVIAAVIGLLCRSSGRERPGRAVRPELPGIVGGKRHRQRLRRPARVPLSLSHADRLPDTRGDGQPRGSGRNRHRRAPCVGVGVWGGTGLAALAGVFAPFMLGSITPAMGAEVTVTSFAVIVIGSLGNPLGTVLGGIVYGISYMLMQSYYSSWANLLPYILLIGILLVRPSGLLGRRVRRA